LRRRRRDELLEHNITMPFFHFSFLFQCCHAALLPWLEAEGHAPSKKLCRVPRGC